MLAQPGWLELTMWPDRRYLDLVGITQPIIQAPMAGANLAEMAIAVSRAGGLGSLPCGMLSLAAARSELERIRQQTRRADQRQLLLPYHPAVRSRPRKPLAAATFALLRRARS